MSLTLHEIAASPRAARHPLSATQRQLWFLDRLQGASQEYNLVHAFRLRGDLDRDALARALGLLVERHEILRTRFVEIDGEPAQEIDPPTPITLAVEYLSGHGETTAWNMAQATLRFEQERPFDLARGRPMRVRLLALGAREWILIIVLHHIVSDGWSEGVFNHELGRLYAACRAGGDRDHGLPVRTVQYADFSRWQQQSSIASRVKDGVAYWTTQLTGAPEQLALPTDRPRPMQRTFAGDRYEARVSAAQSAALSKAGRAQGATLFMTLLAAFGVLLSRHGGDDDVCVGTPLANRHHAALEEAIGFFVNTIVMRLRLQPAMTWRSLIGDVRRTVLDGYRHQETPFDAVVEAVAPARTVGSTPLFQVLLHLENYPRRPLTLDGLAIEQIPPEQRPVRYDLELRVREEAGGLTLTWLFNRDLFDRWRIEQLSRQFVHLIDTLIQEPDACIADARLTSAAERGALLAAWDGVRRDYQRGEGAWARPLPVAIQDWWKRADRHPERSALEHGSIRWSYGDLRARADRFARAIVDLDTAPHARIGIATADPAVMAAAILGTLQAGRSFMPLDPGLPDDRLRFVLDAAGASAIVTDSVLGERFRSLQSSPVVLQESAAAQPRRPVAPDAWAADKPCYLYFTSSSTGAPKEVAGRLRGLDHHVSWVLQAVGASDGVRVSQLYRPTFSAYLRDLFVPLCAGGTICIPPADAISDGAQLAAWLEAAGVEVMSTVPTILRLLLRAQPRGERLARLRHVMVAGEPLLGADVRRWHDTFGTRVRLFNLYGTTETGLAKLAHPVEVDDRTRVHVPAGWPMPGVAVQITDAHGEPCPPGVVGEIRIWSPYLSLGYGTRDELAAASAAAGAVAPGDVDDPTFTSATGDLGRMDRDGRVEVIGRRDTQIKIRGVRISLAEVENAVREEAGVEDVAVIAREEPDGGTRLVACVVGPVGEDGRALRRALQRRLPATLVPALVMRLDRLPLTSNGKIDRRALTALVHENGTPSRIVETSPREERQTKDTTDTAGRALEALICHLTADVLGVATLHPDDDFFDRGGHSLLAMRLMSRIRVATGLDLTIQRLFQHPSVAALLASTAADGVTLPDLEKTAAVPLRPAGPRAPVCCVGTTVEDLTRFAALLSQIDAEHPLVALRTPVDPRRLDAAALQACARDLLAQLTALQPSGPYHLYAADGCGPLAQTIADGLHACGHAASVLSGPGIVQTSPQGDDRFHHAWGRAAGASLTIALQAIGAACLPDAPGDSTWTSR